VDDGRAPAGRRPYRRSRHAWRVVISVAIVLHLAAPAAAQSPGAPPVGDPDAVHAFGPPLTGLRGKIADPNWLVAWLLKPTRLRRFQHMRRLKISVEDAQAVATYLLEGTPPARGTVAWRDGDAQRGERLFVTAGCRGCHTIGASDPSAYAGGPDLAGTGVKLRGDWLYDFLRAPRAFNPSTRMPQVALADDEVRHLVAFLLSQREGADVVASVGRLTPRRPLEPASKVIARFNCSKCHVIAGIQVIEPATGWAAAPRACAGCHAPESVTLPAATDREAALRDGRRLIAYYNCRGCHRIEDRGAVIAEHLERKTLAPPMLDGEGARVQTSWLIDFLRRPTALRPWLQMRMPDFGLSDAEAVVLARYFAALAHVPATDELLDRGTDETAALGQRRFAHFKCVQCHPTRADAPLPEGVEMEDLSINLTLAKRRLRPSWVRAFLGRPKSVIGPETRMPTVFYTVDGVPKVDEPERDITALAAYLMRMTEPTTAVPVQAHPTAPPDWSTYEY